MSKQEEAGLSSDSTNYGATRRCAKHATGIFASLIPNH